MGNPYAKTFTTPVGRLVGGSLYKPNTTDLNGNPLVFKSGPKKDQPGREDYYFAIAIAKSVNPHWASDEWGSHIWAVGHAFMANAGQRAVFSWKVADGDSTVADDKGRRPCDREGYAGHWILHISSGFATKIFKQREGTAPPNALFDPYTTPDAVKTGYYVQVQISCDSNGSTTQPGVYLNHNMVCFTGFGPEISLGGADPSSAGFGAAPLPAGATLTPPANFNPAATPPAPAAAGAVPPPPPLVPSLPPPAPAPVAPAGLVQVPGAQYTIEQCRASNWTDEQMIGAGVATRSVAVPAPLPLVGSAPPPPGHAPTVNAPAPVMPNPAFLQVPPPPAAAPAPAARVMLPAAQGVPYEQYKANGWTDAQLVQNGMMSA